MVFDSSLQDEVEYSIQVCVCHFIEGGDIPEPVNKSIAFYLDELRSQGYL